MITTHLSIAGANYSSYGDLFRAINESEIPYGVIDLYISEAFKVKLTKKSIKVKQVISLQGSIGLLANGEARKLEPSFRYFLKENAELVTKTVQSSLKVNVTHCHF